MTDTMRGAVPLPTGPVRYARTLDDLLARGSGRVSPIQLAPEPQPVRRTRFVPGTRRLHGATGYAAGCRCGICRIAKAAADEVYRAKTRPGKVLEGVRHGTTNAYGKGCRCVDCKAVKAAENAAHKARLRERSAR